MTTVNVTWVAVPAGTDTGITEAAPSDAALASARPKRRKREAHSQSESLDAIICLLASIPFVVHVLPDVSKKPFRRAQSRSADADDN